MLTIDNSMIWEQHINYIKGYDSEASAPLPFTTFISNTFPRTFAESGVHYPVTVKVPKSINELLAGDFEPARSFIVEKPIMKPFPALELDEHNKLHEVTKDIPVWFNTTKRDVFLRFGYENGDSRFMSHYSVGDKNVSAIMGGATGQGKSVTLNNMIFNAALEYPPWELDLVMSDAKVVEFKKYAQFTPLPHISAIAATGDTDYLISVYEKFYNEMMIWNKAIFPKIGVANIMEFRDKTGLTVPRHLLVADEFQTMFKNAGRKLKYLIDIIDGLARLGRSAGFHLFFASQEIGDDIPKGTLANIKLRSCLGAQASVSQKIIGNDMAKMYYGTKGQLVVNDDPTKEGEESKLNNKTYRVPFISDHNQMDIGKQIVQWGDELNFKRTLTFYDEVSVVREKDYERYLNTFSRDKDTICLGEPAFVVEDKEKVLKLHYINSTTENIMLIASDDKDKYRYFKMFEKNLKAFKDEVENIVLALDNVYIRRCCANNLVRAKEFYHDNRIYDNNKAIEIIGTIINRRKLALEADKKAMEENQISPDSDEMLKDYIKNDGLKLSYSQLNRARCFQLNALLRNPGVHRTNFQLESMKESDRERYIKQQILFALFCYEDCDADKCQINAADFKPMYCWILGLDQLIGIGRDSKSSKVTDLKKILMDSSEVAVRFLIFTSSLEDIGDLKVGIKWYVGKMTQRQCNTIKCETYPTEVNGVLTVLYDSITEPRECYKFKKMYLNDELVV